MDAQDVRRACSGTLNALFSGAGVCVPAEHGSHVEHVAWMLCKVSEFYEAGRTEKAMRWLGFAQGFVWSRGYATIDELKDANRPRAAGKPD